MDVEELVTSRLSQLSSDALVKSRQFVILLTGFLAFTHANSFIGGLPENCLKAF